MSRSTLDLRIYADVDALSQAGAELFARQAQGAFANYGRFTVALAGGSTPRPMYERLATPAFQTVVPWRATHVFWGDERCVPSDHPDSNYRMAMDALLSKVPVPPANVHRLAGEQPPHAAADAYAETIRDVLHLAGGEVPRFDLIFLGMGSDGHTASLFPDTDVLHEETRWVTATYVEKLDVYRLTLTLPVINNAAHIIFLVAGDDKAETLHRVLEGPYEPDNLPAQLVQPAHGRLIWLIDQAAAGELKKP